jgi:DHA1 family tetracycline resistance protein-like MFS transporter
VASGGARAEQQAIWTLLAGNALTEVGIGFFLPILPIFLSRRGGSPILVGLIFALGVVARALAQYPGGRLSDRVGRKPVMVAALAVYALLFPAYLLPLPLPALLPLRFVQAFAAGFYLPAAAALVADLTVADQRGQAFGRLRASEMVGLVLGPALGGLVAGIRLESIFVAGALICGTAALVMLRLPDGSQRPRSEAIAPGADVSILRLILPAVLLGSAIYYAFGNYDAVWSLYMTHVGAGTFLVGLSFAAYAVPIVVLSGSLGGVIDRLGPRRAGLLAVSGYGLFNAAYPFITNVAALIGIGVVEGTMTAAGNPALAAEVSRAAPPGRQGRVQGVYQTALTGSEAVGALAGGALYSITPGFAFWAASGVSILGVVAAMTVSRR